MKNKIIVSLSFVIPLVIYFVLCAIYPERSVNPAVAKSSGVPQIIVFSKSGGRFKQSLIIRFEP